MAQTRFSDIARTFKPNVAALGYALFLAINAAGVWGGVFPFLPMNFQTPEITFWFFLAQSLVFSLCYFASAVGVYYFPGRAAACCSRRRAAGPWLSGLLYAVAAPVRQP